MLKALLVVGTTAVITVGAIASATKPADADVNFSFNYGQPYYGYSYYGTYPSYNYVPPYNAAPYFYTGSMSRPNAAKGSNRRTSADCAARYKSYNPETQRYFGSDGHFHKCP